MKHLTTPDEMMAWSDAHHDEGRTIGFVPTMGFLHDGHASLMRHLRPQVDQLVVSIFVNPLQFGPGEDLDTYPRDPDGDAALCAAQGVDAIFSPDTLYPDGFATSVTVAGLTDGLCGAKRPGHFDGVTTVVARLFGLTRCDIACFGQKDYQQLAVLRRMTRDLGLPVTVQGAPLIRDHDGLALSSRNTYLTAEQRQRGLTLHQALFQMKTSVESGELDVDTLRARATRHIQADRLDYLDVVDADSLKPLTTVDRPARALVAGFFGKTRLIDNVALN